MNLSEQVHAIAVHLGKSENMRIAAGQMFDKAWEYIKTPGTDGAKQLSDAGLPITQKALWSMIVYNPSFPAQLGSSWRTGRRVLAIAQSPDPEAAAKAARDAEAISNAKSNAKRSSHRSLEEKDEPLQNGPLNGLECNSPSVTNETGGAQAPFHQQTVKYNTKMSPRPDDRIEAIIKFISPLMEDDEMQEFGKLFEGICDPLSRAIRERAS